MSRVAVVLFNLGGPDGPEAVRPFLFNLFNDPAIIGAPGPLRWLLAKLISGRRAPVARRIYAQIGGKSPLLEETRSQAEALQNALKRDGRDTKVFIAMRYWHPFSAETAGDLAAWAPDRIVLLPLYPQFSTTTTGSSLEDWYRAARQAGVTAPATAIGCYPTDPGLITAHAALIKEALGAAKPGSDQRVLFSAHGLPEKVISGGDPYQWQVEQTAAAVADAVGDPALDWRVCYQSRVGPLTWIGPSTEAEIMAAGRERRSLVIVPIAFVSEHSETLVELDIEYRALAHRHGVADYVRVPALGTADPFIKGLVGQVDHALADTGKVVTAGVRHCPKSFGKCICENGMAPE